MCNLNNGSNGAELEALRATYRDCGYVFRHYAECDMPWFRWQCGREVTDVITLPDGSGVFVERFELLAWSHSMEGLIDKLA